MLPFRINTAIILAAFVGTYAPLRHDDAPRAAAPLASHGLRLETSLLGANPGIEPVPGSVRPEAAAFPPSRAAATVSCSGDGRVLPCYGTASVPTDSPDQTAVFRLTTARQYGDSYDLRCEITPPLTSCLVWSPVDVLSPSDTTDVWVTYSTGSPPGTGTLTLFAASTFLPPIPESWADYTITVTGSSYGVAVTPDNAASPALPNRSNSQRFTVQNSGTVTSTYNLAHACTGVAIVAGSCSMPANSVTLGAGVGTEVTITYNASNTGATGRMSLTATLSGGSTPRDSGWVNVAVGDPVPVVNVADVNPGTTVERDLCLTIAAGSDAAYECGDLRIVHPLPSVRTLNKTRAPALIYNSQHAHPYPLVAANVTVLPNTPAPDSVTASLKIGGVEKAAGRWAGSDWMPGGTRRIVVGFDALTEPTGIYAYTLEVASWYGNVRNPRSATGEFVIVNRSGSPFGAGWWLAGLEQLNPGTMLWLGGDGSARKYQLVTTNTWVAPSVDRPDTLKWNPQEGRYVRYLPHGTKVKFNSTGEHVTTSNRLGHETTFNHAGGLLRDIYLPPSNARARYAFAYSGSSVIEFITLTPPRLDVSVLTTLASSSGRLTSIFDADYKSVAFGYDAAFANRVTTRTDRRNTTTTFGYGMAAKVTQSSVDMGSGQSPIVTGFSAAEAAGITGSGPPSSVRPDSAFTKLLGPRIDADDDTYFLLDRFGAPNWIRNALGDSTVLTRGDSRWPGLVTRVRYPNTRIVGAAYDNRGRPTETTDSSVVSGGVYATTRYAWDDTWDFVEQITQPMGEVMRFTYDALNGNRLWQQPSANTSDASRRVYFRYGDSWGYGLLTSIKTPHAALPAGDPVRDSITYHLGGNVASRVTPRGKVTWVHQDSRGRDTLVISPIGHSSFTDASGFPGEQQRRAVAQYDLWDRDTLATTHGPATRMKEPDPFSGLYMTWPAEILTVRKQYDDEGNIISLARASTPDPHGMGTRFTSWTYDRAHRMLTEIAPDLARDSSRYDPAGNIVTQVTRRNQVVTMEYDELNRLKRRMVPSVYHAAEPLQTVTYTHPRYPNSGTGFRAPGDTATFSYDAMGNVLTANNTDARITRSYNPSGTLRSEEQRIRIYYKSGYADADFNAHVYALGYSYDRNGRRIAMRHPSQLLRISALDTLPRNAAGVQWRDSTRYTYNTVGLPDSVIAPETHAVTYTYDDESRLRSVKRSNNTIDTLRYEEDGRMYNVKEVRPDPATGGYLTAANYFYFYSEDSKVIEIQQNVELYAYQYSGLGALVLGRDRFYDLGAWLHARTEFFRHDALGNTTEIGSIAPPGTSAKRVMYQILNPVSGRLERETLSEANNTPVQRSVYRYDAAGNQELSSRRVRTDYCKRHGGGCYEYEKDDYDESKRFYYGADDKLRLTDRFTDPADRRYENAGGAEEYRYDAFGRRVLRRFRSACFVANCAPASAKVGYVERVVHDGDQLLYEIRAPGGPSATADSIENDRTDLYSTAMWGQLYGRVLYTHGLGIDKAAAVTRIGPINNDFNSTTVFLHANGRGQYTRGTTVTGVRCYYASSTNRNCPSINFAGQEISAHLFPARSENEIDFFWFGSFLSLKQDATGQTYMRNRYYDGQTGRFTQEDPIGLAGGLICMGLREAIR